MKNISELTGQQYEVEECVFFRNAKQSACYKEWGAKLIDLFVDGQLIWVWVFTKKDHNRFKMRWKMQKEEMERTKNE